jgi:hypothetical protein
MVVIANKNSHNIPLERFVALAQVPRDQSSDFGRRNAVSGLNLSCTRLHKCIDAGQILGELTERLELALSAIGVSKLVLELCWQGVQAVLDELLLQAGHVDVHLMLGTVEEAVHNQANLRLGKAESII